MMCMWNLMWIVPLAAAFGASVVALLAAGTIRTARERLLHDGQRKENTDGKYGIRRIRPV